MTTAIISNPAQFGHDEPSHSERAARMRAIQEALDDSYLLPELLTLPACRATDAQLLGVHQPRMLERTRWATQQGDVWLNLDTYTTYESWDAAIEGAGAAVRAVEAVVRGDVTNAFALVRPPGHHATAQQAMGFCLINNIAVAARHALTALDLSRVAIVDYDVHHGNGTQDIFYHDGNVLFCSSHGYGGSFYPGTGAAYETGAGAGAGLNLNMPLPFGTGDTGMLRLYEEVCFPALRRFRPELLLVSAGFDAHWSDPIGPLSMTVAGYAELTARLVGLASELCGGRIVLVLEGGYNLRALGACVVAALRALMGREHLPDPIGPSGRPEPDLSRLIAELKTHPAL